MIQTLLSKTTTVDIYVKLAGIALLLAMFSMLFSMQLMNKFLAISIFFIALNKGYRDQLKAVFSNPIVILTGLLVLFLTIAMFYSAGSLYESYRVWDKYLKILYLILFLPLFFDQNQKWKKNLITILIIATVINEGITYLHYFKLVSFGAEDTKHWLFVQDIDASFILSFMAFLLLNLAVDKPKLRWLYAIIFSFCFYDLYFMNQERTGYLIFLSLMVLFFWQRLNIKNFLITCLFIPMLIMGAYKLSTPFNQRINQAISDLYSYRQGSQLTSIGYRLIFAEYSFAMIKKHYLAGAGTGCFVKLYGDMHGPKLPQNTTPGHPHNEYIFITLQLGIIGLLTLLCWFYAQYKSINYLPSPDRHLAKGLLLGFMVLGFCNCSLYVSPAGVFYVIVMSAFLANRMQQSIKTGS